MEPMRRLLILGTRSLAVEIADLASEIPGYRVVGFVENLERERCKEPLEGLPVHWVDEVTALAEDHWAVCGLATTHRNAFTDQVAALGMRFATLVHPTASLSASSSVGSGSIVSRGVMVAAHTHIGSHVFINRGVLIGHHTAIRDYTTIQPGANVAGCCEIEEAVFIGMGALVLDRIKLGAHSVVGAGSLVNRDVRAGVQVVGAPARIIKTGITGR